MSQQKLYATKKQIEFLDGTQKMKMFIGGRGAGKSATIGHQDRYRMSAMPRGKTFLAAPFFGQILNKTIPSYLETLAFWGLKEFDSKRNPYGQFVLFKKPPSHWPTPYSSGQDYSKIITFCNGYSKELISLYGSDSGRGGSYDGGDIDEAALCDKEDIDKVLLPSLRGNMFRFKTHLHYMVGYYTSPAWLPKGQWIYDFEDLAKEFPDEYLFIESRTADNAAISKHQIELLRKTLLSLEFEVEVMGKRISRLPNGFYPTFSDKKHVVFDVTRHSFDEKTGLWICKDSFIDDSLPIETSWDFNASFTSLLVSQQLGKEHRIEEPLWVKDAKDKSLVVALAELFCEKYQNWKKKVVDIHGDRNGNNRYAGATATHYEEVRRVLQSKGWQVNLKVSGLDSQYHIRHMIIADILGESNPNWPVIRMNGNKCKAFIYALQNTAILKDFKKDKSSEASDMAQEKATHLTDCFDNIIVRKFAKLFGQNSNIDLTPIFI